MAETEKSASKQMRITLHQKAAWMLHEALRHRYHVRYPSDPKSLATARKAGGRDQRLKLYISLLMVLTVFEVPMWCDASGILQHRDPLERCTVKGRAPRKEVYTSGVPFVPVAVGVVLEFTLLALVIRELLHAKFLRAAFAGARNNSKAAASIHEEKETEKLSLLIAGVALLDACLFAVNPGHGAYRVAPYARFALAVSGISTIRRLSKNFVNSFFSVVQIGSFLLGAIVIFAWIGSSLLDDVTGDDLYGDPINTGFETFGNSLYTSFLTSFGANLPDVVVNTFVTNRNYMWLWLPYIFLTVFLFSQVVTAAVYGQFTDDATKNAKALVARQNKSLRQCWQLLMAEGEPKLTANRMRAVTREEFTLVCDELNDFAELGFDMSIVPVMFEALDSDDSGQLTYKEFLGMCDMLEHRYVLTQRDSRFLPYFPRLKQLCDNGAEGPDLGYAVTFEGSRFDGIMNLILALNSAFIVVESIYDFHDWTEPGIFGTLDAFFSFIYLIEVGVKLLVWSWGEYWTSMDNRFDFFTTMVLAAAGFLLLGNFLSPDSVRNLNILRLLRLLKALNNIPIYQQMCELIARMMMASGDVFLMLVLVLYLWGALGMQFYGGLLYTSNPDLKGSDYLDSKFEVYNFNDMGTGIVTLFMFVLGGWVDEVATALLALNPSLLASIGTYAYLLSFYICGSLLAFNIFSAFSIDAFCNLQDLQAQRAAGVREEADVNLDDVRKSLAEKGQCLHVGATGSLLASELRKVMLGDDDGDEGDISAEQPGLTGRLDRVEAEFQEVRGALLSLDERMAGLEKSRA